ncbi:hypothetical protein NPIL_62651 [Nephila pilipes]|uniref:Uncharacterized protein n=1 Tax=Nephila pilipes TaxID=299642 RepID=A0A8X6T866_NEPPI|nr:hypothetical protein NPIL_62651 [Nephila pilipes]
MGRKFPSIHGRNYVNILLCGAPRCGITSLIQSIMSHYGERHVLIHRERNDVYMVCEVEFYHNCFFYCLRICDLSRNTILPPANRNMECFNYDIDVVLYCYSICKRRSLDYLVNLIDERKDVDSLPSVLVGNKLDLRNRWEIVQRSNEDRASFVSHQEAMVSAEELAISWVVECSAETGQSVREVLEAAVYSFCGRKGKRKWIEHW